MNNLLDDLFEDDRIDLDNIKIDIRPVITKEKIKSLKELLEHSELIEFPNESQN